jgi:hypothetical protein
MPWEYLNTDPFKTRYAIAAHAMRDCSNIIELGGFKTPISDFHSFANTLVIDPKLDKEENFEKYSATHRWLKLKFQDVDRNIVEKFAFHKYGILILGIELMMPEKSWQYLYSLINHSWVTVLGTANDHIHSVNQYKKIKTNVKKEISYQINLDLSQNRFPHSEAPPKTSRSIYVLK